MTRLLWCGSHHLVCCPHNLYLNPHPPRTLGTRMNRVLETITLHCQPVIFLHQTSFPRWPPASACERSTSTPCPTVETCYSGVYRAFCPTEPVYQLFLLPGWLPPCLLLCALKDPYGPAQMLSPQEAFLCLIKPYPEWSCLFLLLDLGLQEGRTNVHHPAPCVCGEQVRGRMDKCQLGPVLTVKVLRHFSPGEQAGLFP